MQKSAVVIGAGNVGRGFVGQLFCESGYAVTFVDVDEVLVEAIATRGAYTVRVVDDESVREVAVGPVRALLARDREGVVRALTKATLCATAVGARALSAVAPMLAVAIARRAAREEEGSLNVIVCENLADAGATLRGLVEAALSDESPPNGCDTWSDYLDRHVGFVNAVIGRMIPDLDPDEADADPSLIAVEPYRELPVDGSGFCGEIPDVVDMQAVDGFAVYAARKLYLHNGGHAVLGYLGYRRGHDLGYEALDDPVVARTVSGAMTEAVDAICAHLNANRTWLIEHRSDLLARFRNRALADPVERLARDPMRKLHPNDRLVGAARLAERAGIEPKHLAVGIAAALLFDAPDDDSAAELQRRMAISGVERVLEEVSQISPEEPLGRLVIDAYRGLSHDPFWSPGHAE